MSLCESIVNHQSVTLKNQLLANEIAGDRNQLSKFLFHLDMRQLPGKASKETRRMKRERKQGNAEGHQRVLTIALPVLLGLFALLVAYVYTTASKN